MTALLDRSATPLLIGLVAGLLAIALAFVATPVPADQALLAARWTARAALPLFLAAYLASSLLRLWPTALTRALVRRRRQWGLGFALAHSIHLVALAVNVILFRPRPAETLIGGGVAYLLIYLMALTSNDASMRLLGRWWKRLHRLGIHVVWLVFTVSYVGRFTDGDPDHFATALVLAPLMIAALALRLWARFRPRAATG